MAGIPEKSRDLKQILLCNSEAGRVGLICPGRIGLAQMTTVLSKTEWGEEGEKGLVPSRTLAPHH